jgi:flagellar protein FlbD
MITVTRLDGSEYLLNADLIEFVEAKPDTHITLLTGKKLVVRESAAEVAARVVGFRQRVGGFPPGGFPRAALAAGLTGEEEGA